MAFKKESRVSATEARVHFGEIMRRVENGEMLVVERNGEPRMIMMSVEHLDTLTAQKAANEEPDVPEWKRKLDKASQMVSRDLAGRTIDWEKVIHDMRDERSRQLLGYLGDTAHVPHIETNGEDRE